MIQKIAAASADIERCFFYLDDEDSSFVEVMDIVNIDGGYYLNATVFDQNEDNASFF